MVNLLNVSRVAFSIGSLEVYWYGVIICFAIIIAIAIASLYAKKRKRNPDIALNIALVILPTGIIGARLFSVLFDAGLNITDFFNFRTGGLSIIGAVIGGGIGLLVYCLIKKEKNPFIYFDTLAVVVILAQAIGRWGNYFNQEVYGQIIEAGTTFARFPFAVEIDGVFYQALFFYESVLDLLGFVGLSFIYLFVKDSGYTTAAYLMYYGTIRIILETFRQSEYVLRLAGLPISQICSGIMIAAGAALLIYLILKSKKNTVRKNNYGKKVRKV